jgi:hypothetical protein
MSTVTKRGGKSMFTTQHYKAIAETIRELEANQGDSVGIGDVGDAFVALFAADNERFDRDTFRTAAGLAMEDEQPCVFCDTYDTGRFDDEGRVCVDCKGSRFVAEQWPGVAVWLHGYVTETVHPECPGHSAADEPNDGHAGIGDVVYCDGSCQPEETETDYDRVRVVMVGDDRQHEVELADLTKINDDAFCSECGQVGCGHDGRAEEA